MGLRVNTNVTAIRALRSLRINDRNQARSLNRLSTGLRINSAADDPSGLVISEQLRVQISSLNQAVENSQNAANLISTADAALGELGDLLVQIRDSVTFALNTGPSSPEQISAEQDSVDQAINAIDRIANTTRFADTALLNGNRALGIVTVGSQLNDLSVRSVTFPDSATSATFTVNVSVRGSQAALSMGAPSLQGGASSVTLRVTGPRGTADITAANSGGSVVLSNPLTDAINQAAGFTGVYASSFAGNVWLLSEDFGTEQVISLEVLAGDAGGGSGTLDPGFRDTDAGVNYQVLVNGVGYTGNGRDFSVVTPFLDAQFSIAPSTPSGVAPTFTVRNSGMFFQLNTQPRPTDGIQVGIDSLNAGGLGTERIADLIAIAQGAAGAELGGFLTELRTGAASDLTNDPSNAAIIVDSALDKVNSIRGYLGALSAQTLEPNIDALGVSIENLQASESSIRDLDFAEETSIFTRNQILFQAGTAVLASANLIPQTVLTLLR